MNDARSNTLVVRYRLALGLVAALVLLNQALVQPALVRMTDDASLLNVAGRQRMLSQRLAKAALAVGWRAPGTPGAGLGEVREVLDRWSAAHETLRSGGPPGTAPGRNSPEVQAGLDALTPLVDRIRGAARRLIRTEESGREDPAALRADLAEILDHEGEYLRRMDEVVGLYEREARGRVERLRRVGWLLSASTLAGLAAIGGLILRPAVRVIRAQVDALARARDELEVRVRERTRELEDARQRHRELLEQLGRASRTATIGELASSLAHELNQPLGAVANYAEGCLIELASDQPRLDEVRDALGRLRAATMRAGQILDRVRRFVTRRPPAREPLDANRLVREVSDLLDGEARRLGVVVALDLARALPSPPGDPVQVQQVLMNLARNALDALAAAQTLTRTLVFSTRAADDGGLEFAVADNGEGIPPDRIERIFDAYFSTRAEGMGMGLAICRTIAEAHHGRILVYSERGVRTTFRFLIPPGTDGDEADAGADGLHRR